ncbi:MAG: sensor histidine kinase [Acutalibacter sp.]
MDTSSKSTEQKSGDVFRGVISWLCFLILLCGATGGMILLISISLDPISAGNLGGTFEQFVEGTYRPGWLPVASVTTMLFVVVLLVMVFALAKDRHYFEMLLAHWLKKVWVEFKLVTIAVVMLFTLLVDINTTLGGFFSPVAAVLFLYFLCLDIGKNRQFFRHNIIHSALNSLNQYRELTSFEQRSIRRVFSTLAVIIGVLGVAAVVFRGLLNCSDSPIRNFFLLGTVGFAAAGVIGSVVWYILSLKRDLRDWSILMAQIAEMYGGNLNAVNHMPPTSNLYDCAMQLNMIRTGIQKAVEEGIKADRTKVELITNVSHDIKTPLTSIISYVELLKKEPNLPPHVMDYIKTISNKADRLNHIVQDVFEVSKAATGNISLNMDNLDIGKLLQQTFGEMDMTVRNSGLTWRVDIPDTPMIVHADGQRLYRVFQNLIRNCAQYSLPGSRVYVNLTAQNGSAVATIRNISKNEITMDAEHLTARFVRGDQNRTTEGSGLGLSIAKSFTEACGGKFTVHTDGDLFVAAVAFPLVMKATAPVPAPASASVPPAPQGEGERPAPERPQEEPPAAPPGEQRVPAE